MRNYFTRSLNYTTWANKAVCKSLLDNQIQDENCIQLMSHIWLAQINWYNRITLQQQDQPVWQSLPLTTLPELFDTNRKQWLAYIQQLDEEQFDQVIAYRNLAKLLMVSTIEDILTHVVNHATHHRGQLVRRIRELGFVPPSTDFITSMDLSDN